MILLLSGSATYSIEEAMQYPKLNDENFRLAKNQLTASLNGFNPIMAFDERYIKVNHEWGDLKEVIVGTGEGLIVPEYNDKVSFIYDPKGVKEMIRYGGQKAISVDPERTVTVIAQINRLLLKISF